MKRYILLISILALLLFGGCSIGITPLSIDVSYLERVNDTIYYNGSIDITGQYLVNGSPLSTGGGSSSWEYPLYSNYSYNSESLLENISNIYSNFTTETIISYNNSRIQTVFVDNSYSGSKTINYLYDNGFLIGVTYS
jgi:hypothetical protein